MKIRPTNKKYRAALVERKAGARVHFETFKASGPTQAFNTARRLAQFNNMRLYEIIPLV